MAFSGGETVWIPEGGLLGISLVKTPIFGGYVDFRSFNQFNQSPSAEEPFTYGYRAQTPYSPLNLKGERIGGVDTKLTWHARKRTRGARQFVVDNQTAQDEIGEGSWEITGTGGFGPIYVNAEDFSARDGDGFLIPPNYTRAACPAGVTYTVRSFLNGRFSAGVQVTI